jgi:hypothetical protein
MSPISPQDRGRHPADWDQISRGVKDRAGWRCECAGECGLDHLGRCRRRHGDRCADRHGKPRTVALGTAHLDHTPENRDPANLKAMCQGSYLRYDIDHHRQTAARTAREAREAAGQGALDLEGVAP